MKIEHVLFPSVFSKLRIRVSEGHFYCVHMIRCSELTKIGSCERALRILENYDNDLHCCNMRKKDIYLQPSLHSVPFIFQEECRMKIEDVLFPSVFSKLQIRVSEGHFYCVHMIRCSELTKIGSCERALSILENYDNDLHCCNMRERDIHLQPSLHCVYVW